METPVFVFPIIKAKDTHCGGRGEGKEMRNVHGVVNFEHITKSDIQKYSIPYFLRLTHCSSTVLIPQMEGERGVGV